jgi:putative transcriptional regulator
MSTVKRSIEQIRANKGRIDRKKLQSTTEEQIAEWNREDDVDESTLGPIRFVPPATDVRALRERLRLSQEEFARRYMLSPRTIQEWEQGRREPVEAARVLLYAIASDPAGVAKALRPLMRSAVVVDAMVVGRSGKGGLEPKTRTFTVAMPGENRMTIRKKQKR